MNIFFCFLEILNDIGLSTESTNKIRILLSINYIYFFFKLSKKLLIEFLIKVFGF